MNFHIAIAGLSLLTLSQGYIIRPGTRTSEGSILPTEGAQPYPGFDVQTSAFRSLWRIPQNHTTAASTSSQAGGQLNNSSQPLFCTSPSNTIHQPDPTEITLWPTLLEQYTTPTLASTKVASPTETPLATAIETQTLTESLSCSNTSWSRPPSQPASQSFISSISSASPIATMAPEDIFDEPVDTKPPPSMFQVREDHPVPLTHIAQQSPIQTNKFYSNFFLENQTAPAYTFPYSIAWTRGEAASWGIACSHVEARQRVWGTENPVGTHSYFINPIGIRSMIISAKELSNRANVSVDSITAFSARVHLSPDEKSPPLVSLPLVQGMAYITAEYSGSTPVLQSGVFFKTVTRATRNPKDHLTKFTFTLEDNSTWRAYAWRTKGEELDLQVVNNGYAAAKKPFTGILQICKDPMTNGSESLLDDGAGVYPVTVKLSGSANRAGGSYRFSFLREGHKSGNLYTYALPHHIDSFDDDTKTAITKLQLQTPTKGIAHLVRGDQWTMIEPNLPMDMSFAPWHPVKGNMSLLSDRAKGIIRAAAAAELAQNMIAQTDLDSMYFSGKALAKFALILYVVNDMVGDKALAETGLGQLKAAFGAFAANKQKFPLLYDRSWGGVVSSATYVTGDKGADFGNSLYNDHHFHYGYHILAAAIIGHLDPHWLESNRDYVNTLVRDVANPSTKDPYFPTWRNFDWYHGHSWAHGLYASWDGKNQESSSEDMMHAYALKMWGKVNGDGFLEARSNLQLSIISRSLRHYYLYLANNTVQPSLFIGNKVAGILFENKIDHTTFFSPEIEAIQGIHMIPILAPSPFVRTPDFVKEEWGAFFSDGRIDGIRNAWKGIIYASYASVDPKLAWEFFSSKEFDPQWLDGGASLTWFLAFAAALGEL